MTNIVAFQSQWADLLIDFAAFKRSGGYRAGNLDHQLRRLDRFLAAEGATPPIISRVLAERYLAQMPELMPRTRAAHFGRLSQFCRFLHARYPDCFVPDREMRPQVPDAQCYYLYSQEEIHALIAAAEQLRPGHFAPLQAQTMATLIHLLATTGLRISEALKLRLPDVDWEEGVLFVKDSKFGKSRLVPVGPETRRMLYAYVQLRLRAPIPQGASDAVFVSRRGTPYSDDCVRALFGRLVRQALHKRGPRLHDLRHSFAVRRLLDWYRDGQDVMARLPLLTAYLGHVNVANTSVYLHATAELLSEANARFRQYAGAALTEVSS